MSYQKVIKCDVCQTLIPEGEDTHAWKFSYENGISWAGHHCDQCEQDVREKLALSEQTTTSRRRTVAEVIDLDDPDYTPA